jgi:aminopeptidase
VIDPESFASLICDWCIEAAPGQQVTVTTSTLAQDAVLALHGALLDRGAWPLLRLSPPELDASFYRHARGEHLDGFAPLELTECEMADASVRISAPANTRELSDVEPDLPARVARARAPVSQARLAKRWCGTIWPTAALAQQGGMSLHDYAGFVERALFLDRPDPVAAWRELSAHQAHIVERLSSAREIRIQARGTDLRLSVEGRTWVNSDGRRNMPSGEVFTGPLERSAEGTIYFGVPSLMRGAEVAGVHLTFSEGRVVDAGAERGGDQLAAALASDDGARYLGEIGIGTNTGIDRPTGSTLLDEKMAGTVHLALGRSYPETGGVNDSTLHWDLICDLRSGGGLYVDDELLIRDGALAQ